MSFKEINCPLCGTAEFVVLKKSDSISDEKLKQIYRSSSDTHLFEQVVRCNACSLVYLNPILDSKFIVDSYKDAIDDKFVTQNQYRIETFKRGFQEILVFLGIESNFSKMRTLDIGCAGGAFLKAVKDLGGNPVGVEPSKYLSDFARREYGVEVYSGILEEQDFGSGSFDIITMWDVVEHLTDPNQVFSDMRRIVKDQGYLVINYPDYSTLIAKIMGWKWPFWLSVHLTYFTPKTITRLIEANGFKVLRMKRHWQKLEFGYLLERAAYYFPIFKYVGSVARFFGLSHLPCYYYLGQIQVVAKVK